MYFMGECFQNNLNTPEIKNIINSIETFPEMKNVTSEKGNVLVNSTSFDKDSLFFLVENIHRKKGDTYIF